MLAKRSFNAMNQRVGHSMKVAKSQKKSKVADTLLSFLPLKVSEKLDLNLTGLNPTYTQRNLKPTYRLEESVLTQKSSGFPAFHLHLVGIDLNWF